MVSKRVRIWLKKAVLALAVISAPLCAEQVAASQEAVVNMAQASEAFTFSLDKDVSVRLALPANYKAQKSMSHFKRKGSLDFIPDNAPAGPGRENVILTRDFAGPKVLLLTAGLLDAVEEGLRGVGATIFARQTENLGGYVRTSLGASYTQNGRSVVVYMVYYGGSAGEVIGLQWARPVFEGETPQSVFAMLQKYMQESFVVS